MPRLDFFGSTFTLLPRTGRLLVFPPGGCHYVRAYRPRVDLLQHRLRTSLAAEPPSGTLKLCA
jgi:hypothetical protein